MYCKVILVGRLAADPELRTTPGGHPVANLRLATNTYTKDEAGSRQEHAEFHHLVMFGRQAEVAGEHLRKGRLLLADGRLQTRSWEDAEGRRRQQTEVLVDSFQMLEPKPGSAER